MFKRTGKTQTELTPSGVITTAEERHTKTKARRWVQIGYTSIIEKEIDGQIKKVIDGKRGQALGAKASKDDNIDKVLYQAQRSNGMSLRRPDTASHSFCSKIGKRRNYSSGLKIKSRKP